MAETPLSPENAADQPLPDPVEEAGPLPSPPTPKPAPEPEPDALDWVAEAPEPASSPAALDRAVDALTPESIAAPPVETVGSAIPPAEPPIAIDPVAAPPSAGVAATIAVPPLPGEATADGGEWELLMGKLRAWLEGAGLQERWNALGGPLRMLGLLLAAVVLLRLYSALLETLGDLPLLPRLLQLVGLVSLTRFALTRLVRSSERERILSIWSQRWNDFRGGD
jgi:hypothetical protein